MPGETPGQGKTGRASGFAWDMPRAYEQSSKKSAYEAHKAHMNSTDADPFSSRFGSKRQGFKPAGGVGDEPMASNTSAYANTSRERPQFAFGGPPPGRKKATRSQADKQRYDGERLSSRYATTGGEKTFFSSAGLGRSNSARDSPGRSKSPSPTPNAGRHRSVSPRVKSENGSAFADSTSSSDSEDEVFEQSKPFRPKVPKSRLRPDQKFSDCRTSRNETGTGERLPRSKHGLKTRELESLEAAIRSLKRHRENATADRHTKEHDSDSAAFPNNSQRPSHNHQTRYGSQSPLFKHFRSRSTKRSRSPAGNRNPGLTGFTANRRAFYSTQNGSSKSSSQSNMNGKFSADDWHNAFQGASFFSPTDQPRPTDSGSQSNGQNAPQNGFTSNSNSGTSSHDCSRPTSQQKPTPFSDVKFSADDWAKQFQNLSWLMSDLDPSHKRTTGTQPARSPTKQPKSSTKVRSAPQAASVATEAEEAKTTVGREGRQSMNAGGGEAMDVDEDSFVKQPVPASTKPANDDQRPASQPKPATSSDDKSKAGNDFFNFNKLRETDPFTNTNSGGIGNLADILSTLPFESRAKTAKSTLGDIRPRELNCPNPPKRPRVPALVPVSAGSTQQALPRSTWNRYVAEMNTYMREWNDFNRRMLRHFNARQEAIETGLAPGWISAVGDSARIYIDAQDGQAGDGATEVADTLVAGTAKGGYSAYLRGLEEDVRVRKHWDVASEMHQECIMQLGQIREWIRNGGKLV